MVYKELKDYYRILELQPNARKEDIKQAYRRLALKYHPDTNGSDYAVFHFREIKEAYDVLSHDDRRRKYDEERWLNGMGERAKGQVVITPEWILQEVKKLSRHMDTVDTYRMSHSALHDYVMLLLSDAHMAILLQAGDNDINETIVKEILQSIRRLKFVYKEDISKRMAELVPAHNELLERIFAEMKQSEKRDTWEKYLPLFIVLVTLALCIMMFFYSRK